MPKTLIEYNNNSLEENDEVKKILLIDIELTEQKADLYNDENSIDFNNQI